MTPTHRRDVRHRVPRERRCDRHEIVRSRRGLHRVYIANRYAPHTRREVREGSSLFGPTKQVAQRLGRIDFALQSIFGLILGVNAIVAGAGSLRPWGGLTTATSRDVRAPAPMAARGRRR